MKMKKIVNFIKRLLGIPSNSAKKNEANKSTNLYQQSLHNSNEHKVLSDDDLVTLLERANMFLMKDDCKGALSLYSQIIDETASESMYLSFLLSSRSSIFSKIHDWDSAIIDIKRCISNSPDDSSYYLTMGVYITWKHFYSENFRIDDHNEVLKESIYYYKECLKRNPTDTTAWLNTIETYLFIRDWDNAQCHLGLSKSYIVTKENKLVWAWLSCLSLALAGDPIDNDDVKILLDRSIQYETNHDYQQIDCVISELERIQFHPKRVNTAKEMHRMFKERIGAK